MQTPRVLFVIVAFVLVACAVIVASQGTGPTSAVGVNSITSPDTGLAGSSASLALDTLGNPVVSYSGDTGGHLKLLHCGDPNCTSGNSITVPDASVEMAYTSLALDGAGNPVVSYRDTTHGDLRVLHCNDADCAGGDDSITSPDTIGDVGIWSSLALDSFDNPVVSYLDNTNYDLKVLHCNDVDCAGGDESITSPDTVGFVGGDTSLALDVSGNPAVSYRDFVNGDLKILRCNDANCAGGDESITSPDTADLTGVDTSLALDASDYPVVSYYLDTGGDLRLLHCNDANCAGGDESITSPDTAGFVGRYSSLALASGNPVVSYYDISNGNLKILNCNDANCSGGDESITSPDTAGDVGSFTSLALDGAGNPVVGYLDTSNFDLKLLHCGDPDCTPPIPTPTVTSPATATPTSTRTATATVTPGGPTDTPGPATATPTSTRTATATITPGGPTFTPSATPTRTRTPTPGGPTDTPTPTGAGTATPTSTRTATLTVTPGGPTDTSTPTAAGTATPTSTRTATLTVTPGGPTDTSTPTGAATATPTSTRTATATITPGGPTFTPSATATRTRTPTPGGPTATPTSTVTSTATPSPVEQVSTAVPAGGGTATTGTGDPVEGTLSFAGGDLSAPETTITIDVFNSADVAPPPGGGSYLSRAFDFGPDGLSFTTPITFTIVYTSDEVVGLDEMQLGVWLFDSLTDEWSPAQVIARDFAGPFPHSLTVAVPHFSRAAIGDLSTSNFDGDGCTDSQELGSNQLLGGLRDPTNPNDYFNPSHDGTNRIDDILMVIRQYFIDSGNPAYNPDTDRTPLGPNVWNLGPPNGLQRVDDILAILAQYYHDCS